MSKLYNSEKVNAGWPLVAFAAMLWGTDLLIRPSLLRGGLNPAQIVLAEHVTLSILFLPVIIRGWAEIKSLSGRDWVGLVFIAWAGSAIGTYLLTRAYQLGSPLTATLLQKSQPLYAVLLAGIFLKERRTAVFWIFFVGAIVATYLISFGWLAPEVALSSPSAPAAMCAIAAAALWGSCTVVGRVLIKDLSPALTAGWRFLLAVPLLAVMAGTGALNIGAILFHPNMLLPLALIVLLPDVLGMTLYYTGLRTTSASLATLAELAYPASALVLGIVFGGQKLRSGQWLGFALLAICLQAIQSSSSVRAPVVPQKAVSPMPVQET